MRRTREIFTCVTREIQEQRSNGEWVTVGDIEYTPEYGIMVSGQDTIPADIELDKSARQFFSRVLKLS